MLLQSLDRGDTWVELSSDLTTNDSVKIAGKGHMMYCTITTISESPVKAGVIWVGTDDGKVHVTPDFGKTWKELTQNLVTEGALADRWVNRIVASNFSDSVAYVCKSGFKFDDFKPYIYKTMDMGDTWTDISGNLPEQPVNVIVEDIDNPELLFVGNDIGIFFTLDGGTNWQRMEGNIPFVPVKDIVIHPREKDLIAGTYGRGAVITNISALEQMTPDVTDSDIFFFDILPKPVRNVSDAAYWGNNRLMGDKHLFTPNEPNGLRFDYYLKKEPKHEPEFLIYDETGQAVDTPARNIRYRAEHSLLAHLERGTRNLQGSSQKWQAENNKICRSETTHCLSGYELQGGGVTIPAHQLHPDNMCRASTLGFVLCL
jgi:hypothetical protein